MPDIPNQTNIFCLQCASANVEAHSYDQERNITTYWCIDCGCKFTNFNLAFNYNLRYKFLALTSNEFTQNQLLESSIKNLHSRGVEQIMTTQQVNGFICSGQSYFDKLLNLCFIETMFNHIVSTTTP